MKKLIFPLFLLSLILAQETSKQGYIITSETIPILLNLSYPKIERLKLSPDKKRIAFNFIDNINDRFFNLAIVNIRNGKTRIIVDKSVKEFAWLNNSEIIYML
ncbi:hypothetical protein J7L36_00325, partial [bacterium]|nr:hypothetical protein [bacterium]